MLNTESCVWYINQDLFISAMWVHWIWINIVQCLCFAIKLICCITGLANYRYVTGWYIISNIIFELYNLWYIVNGGVAAHARVGNIGWTLWHVSTVTSTFKWKTLHIRHWITINSTMCATWEGFWAEFNRSKQIPNIYLLICSVILAYYELHTWS